LTTFVLVWLRRIAGQSLVRIGQRIGNAHFADQPADLQRHNRPATTSSRPPAPIKPKTRTMPANNGARLNDRQGIASARKQSIKTNEYHSVDGTERELLWNCPPQNVYLLPQRPNLCLNSCPRPDQIDDCPTNEPAKIPHPTTGLSDSRSTASRMRFTIWTPLIYGPFLVAAFWLSAFGRYKHVFLTATVHEIRA
jgi:hypothetical protein